jgi:hypothetical protein
VSLADAGAMVVDLRGDGLGLGLAERVAPGMARAGARGAFRDADGLGRRRLGLRLRLGPGLTAGSPVREGEGSARLGGGSAAATTASPEDIRSSQPVAIGKLTNDPPTTTAAAAGTR